MQPMPSVGETPDFHLASVELSLAKNAKALIVERCPGLELVLGAQNPKSVFGREVSFHWWRRNSLLDCGKTDNRGSG
jgi:hypothetical protein